MTQEQINKVRIAIAERLPHVCGCDEEGEWRWRWPRTDLFNPHVDLNAMHEAEKVLNLDQWHYYKQWLGGFPRTHNGVHATAPQRFEAFLKTIGKW